MTRRSTEIATHLAQQATLKALFEAQPFVVIPHAELVAAVGENFRSRLKWVRQQLGVIDNVPVYRADGTRGYGSYVYRPQSLGRDASTFTAAPVRLPMFDGPEGAYRS